MESCLLLPHLETSLLRRGLPEAYVRRAIGELEAHCGDVAETRQGRDLAAAERVVGDPAALAERLVQQYRAARFAGRHPLRTFLLLPLPATLLLWIACLGSGAAVVAGLSTLFGEYSFWTFTAMDYLHRLAGVVPQLLTGFWFWRLSGRSGWGRKWAIPACAIVALTWWLFQSELALPTAPGTGRLTVGLGASAVLVWPAVLSVLAAAALCRSDRRWAAT